MLLSYGIVYYCNEQDRDDRVGRIMLIVKDNTSHLDKYCFSDVIEILGIELNLRKKKFIFT